ncbi:MAG TPA: ATP12 family protein [Alphaproteobacteria bacterium]
MKKFYKVVTAAPVFGGYEIHLDGRPVKTPGAAPLVAPTQKLADVIVREWAGQDKDIVPESMPLTQILITAQDRVPRERAVMEKTVLAFLDTDLLCYRAVLPAAVAERQSREWDPWLDWFEKKYGVPLQTTESLLAVKQPDEAHAVVAAAVRVLDHMAFTVLQLAASLSGSLVLGLAFVTGAATPEQVFAAAHVEESFKGEIYDEAKYGVAPNDEKRRAGMLRDLEAARAFLSLL